VPFSKYIAYVDESGDPSLTHVNPQHPVFVLAFCIFEKTAYSTLAVPEIQRLKFDYWGHDSVVLHSHEIRNQRNDFRILASKATREQFLSRISAAIDAMPVMIVAAAIDKNRLSRRYAHPGDPYQIGLTFCLERLQRHLMDVGQSQDTTHIVIEARGAKEDRDLELAFRRIVSGNNVVGPMPNLDIRFMDKKHNSTGLQIADLVAYPIARHVVDPTKPNPAYDVVVRKFRRGPAGTHFGFGLKVFP
jgi:hypothetical protein